MIDTIVFSRARRIGGAVLVAAAALQFGGCANVTLPAAAGTSANVEKLKGAGAQPMAAGEFKAAPGKATEADKGLSIRGSNSIAPAQGSFALQLRDQLAVELKAAGLQASDAKVVVSGLVTDNQLETGISKGLARLAARFTVRRDGQVAYEKEHVVEQQWEPSFIAATAVPDAFNRYGSLYQTLIGKLLDDPAFRAAVRR